MTKRISRRGFIKLGIAGTAGTILAGCQQPRRWVTLEPYVTPPEEQVTGQATWYASTCRQCPAGCGIVVRIMNGRAVKIEGNPEHPLNQGKLCARGQAGLQVLYDPDRLPGAVRQDVRGSRQFAPLEWNEALNRLYDGVNGAGSSLAVWLGSTTSGHLVDLFRRFTKAVGAPDPVVYDLYTAFHGYHALQSADAALFAQDALPAYELSQADVILSFGANFLGTWLSSTRYGVELGDFRTQPLGKRGYLIQLEPRMSITAATADQWVPIVPGTEGLAAQALVQLIADNAFGSAERVQRAQALAAGVDVNTIAQTIDVPVSDLTELARVFATAGKPVAIPGSTAGGGDLPSEPLNAMQALNVIAGIDGLRLSPLPPLPALVRRDTSSLEDVKALITKMKGGEIKTLLVHGANPIFDLPASAGLDEAIKSVPLVVSFSPVVDETAQQADLILPDRTYLKSWGYEVVAPGFGEAIVSSQQPVVKAQFDARSTGDVLLTVARGIPAVATALPWNDEVAFLKETITKLPPGAAGGSGAEVLWSRFRQHGGWWPASPGEGTAPQPAAPAAVEMPLPQFEGDPGEYPYYLHLYLSDLLSDGRGANQTWLQGSPDPMTTISWQTWVELNPQTAAILGVIAGDVVRITSPHGEVEAPVYVFPAIRPDTVALPLGQGHTDYGRYAVQRGANPLNLVNLQPFHSDSGGWTGVRVKVEKTGRKVQLAVFENTAGVNEGYQWQHRNG